MMWNTAIYFIAGRIATELEKAAIEELRKLAKVVLLRAADLVENAHDKADVVAGTIPPAYAEHTVAPLQTVPTGCASDLAGEVAGAIEHLGHTGLDAAIAAVDAAWGAPVLPSADGWPTAPATPQ